MYCPHFFQAFSKKIFQIFVSTHYFSSSFPIFLQTHSILTYKLITPLKVPHKLLDPIVSQFNSISLS